MAAESDADQAHEERLQIEDLRTASARRHLLTRGTPDYEAAMEVEERLDARIWRRVRAAAGASLVEPAPGGQVPSCKPRTSHGGRRSRRSVGSD
jgi:hypothetical protein